MQKNWHSGLWTQNQLGSTELLVATTHTLHSKGTQQPHKHDLFLHHREALPNTITRASGERNVRKGVSSG
jgi:hypothetical protein